jgi:ABC-type methionine transport system ATPase subunit
MGGLARSDVGRQSAIFDLNSMASRTKQEIVRERIYLTFPQDLIKEPVLSMLAKQFDVVFNIRGSTVTSNMGLVALEIDGKAAEVAKAIGWLKGKGVTVEPIEKNVIE